MAKQQTSNSSAQMELFCAADIFCWTPKSDRHTMEHPFFSISKVKDTKLRRYDSPDGKCWLELTPSIKGLATIWDRDVIIYAVSVLRDAIANGAKLTRDNPQPINVTAYNFLDATKRGSGGSAYTHLSMALDRLQGTIVKTNIGTDTETTIVTYPLIQEGKMVVDNKSGKTTYVEITLPKVLWQSVFDGLDLLAIDREYFDIAGGLERRVYELARKHCGHQAEWRIGLEKLHAKSGSQSGIPEFKRMLKQICARNDLPSYFLQYDNENSILIVKNRILLSLTVPCVKDESPVANKR